MKRIFTLSVLVVSFFVSAVAQTAVKTKGRNIIYAGMAVDYYFEHNAAHLSFSLEYDRVVKERFHVGLLAGHKRFIGRPATCWYPAYSAMNVSSLTALAYYNLPVARKLSLQVGAGPGLAYHEMTRKDDSDGDTVKTKDWAAPGVCVRARWVVHITDWMEMTFSPLILGPSTFFLVPFSPVEYGGELPVVDVLQIALGIRF